MKEEHIILHVKRHSAMSDVFEGASNTPGFSPRTTRRRAESFSTEVTVEKIDKKDIQELRTDPGVIGIAPNIPMKLIKPKSVVEYNVAEGESYCWGIEAVGALRSQFTGEGIKVAVLDTGIKKSHPCFDGINIVERNFTDETDEDINGHGTHVAGIIVGREVNGYRIGVAPGVNDLIVGKVLSESGGNTVDIYRAVKWAADLGANIISMSLGSDYPGYVQYLMDLGLPPTLAADKALVGYGANIKLFSKLAELIEMESQLYSPSVVIAAAGNDCQRHLNPDYEISISPPAAADGILSVGALDRGRNKYSVAYFSNTGVDISAPGVEIVSANLKGGLTSMDGTSMATPHVAGIMALWAQKLKRQNQFDQLKLVGNVIANASTHKFKKPFEPMDVGAGIVQAP